MNTLAFGELLEESSRLFAKSEFGPANKDWPALSFSSPGTAREVQQKYQRGRDFVIFVGTSNPDDTPNPLHRQRLMSITDVEQRAYVETSTIVSKDSWERAQQKYPGRWNVSFRLARAWDILDFPRAHDVLPVTYAKFTNPGTRGHIIEVDQRDYPLVRDIRLTPVDLVITDRAAVVLDMNVENTLLKKELSRLSALIQNDVAQSLKTYTAAYPLRGAPNLSDVFAALNRAWKSQRGLCALCKAPIHLDTKNKLLKISRDRIDSTVKNYSEINVHLTHLGCNLAKSDATVTEWEEYLAALRVSSL